MFPVSDLPRRAGGWGRGRVDGVPALGDRPLRAQPHQQAEEAEAEGEGLQEGRGRTEGEECDGGLQSQGEGSEENDEIRREGRGWNTLFIFLEIHFRF